MSSAHDDENLPPTLPSSTGSEDPDLETFEEEESRAGLLSSVWFRAVLVLVIVGVVAIISVPYVMDWVSAPDLTHATAPRPTAPPQATVATPAVPSPTPGAQAPSAAAPPTPAPAPAPSPVVATPPAPPPPTPKPSPTTPDRLADKPAADVKPADVKPPEVKASATPKSTPKVAAAAPAAPSVGRAAAGYWVQVGAYKDAETAKRVATRLREQNFGVAESVVQTGVAGAPVARGAAPSPESDRYDVVVTAVSPAELTAKLAGKGLTAQAVANGAMITPSLPLRDAVALSKELAADGFKVQVKRTGLAAGRPAPTAGGETLHRVRVGAFADRAEALEAARDLEAKGYKPFVARGTP